MKTSSRSGVTLLELLVAFIIFVLMIGALVSLANTGLDTWTSGEGRKDIYDRAQMILRTVTEDLRGTVVENEIATDGRQELMPATLLCDFDKNRSLRLRLVRSGDMDRVKVPPSLQITKRTPSMYTGDFWEVAYVPHSDGSMNTLYRAVRYFDRRREYTLLRDEDIAWSGSEWFQRHATVLDRGVLFLGFRSWTQDTETWLPAGSRVHTCSVARHRSLVQLAGPGKCPVCQRPTVERVVQASEAASELWDSTRRLEQGFRYHKRRQDPADPDFVYPEIVQVVLVLESHASEIRGLRLDAPVGESDMVIRVTDTRGLSDPPGFVKIDSEWIEYEGRTYDEMRVRRRGSRGTKAAAHPQGSIVRFGETFVTEVRMPAFRHATVK